jgi:hypothetical protein
MTKVNVIGILEVFYLQENVIWKHAKQKHAQHAKQLMKKLMHVQLGLNGVMVLSAIVSMTNEL